jgi:hypothetical protein
MRKQLFLVCLVVALSSFSAEKTLSGTWEYRGSLLNGKKDGAPKDYKLQRKYTDLQYNAYVIEEGQKTQKYESGKYKLKGDTCFETQTYCSQASKLIGVTVHYIYRVKHDTLFLLAKLPNGNIEEDCWKKVK